MLTSLSIKNYALIDRLHVWFGEELVIITGETGAGKSILLGALSLLLGKRADVSSVKDPSEKCVIEGEFALERYALQTFFEQADLDYESRTIIRRELLPSGKSRAFVNDTPVNLQTLSALGERLIDIHSQHQTLEVASQDFQFSLIDALADCKRAVADYRVEREKHRQITRALRDMQDAKAGFEKEQDYNSFLCQELIEARLEAGQQEPLEQEYEVLSNTEAIQENLSEMLQLLQNETAGTTESLREVLLRSNRIREFSPRLQTVHQRLESLRIELDDLTSEVAAAAEQLDADPERLQAVNERLQTLYALQKKHQVDSVEALLQLQAGLQEKIEAATHAEGNIAALESQLSDSEKRLDKQAETLHQKRKAALPGLKERLENVLKELGLLNARFHLELEQTAEWMSNGKDKLRFLFTANKGATPDELKKVASGGELSRIMLAVKSVLAHYEQLPTLVFDEIDAGVSGEIALKMAGILDKMAGGLQIVCITHLPQIAAKGKQHLKVYKEDVAGVTTTRLKELDTDQRVLELAEMLSGHKSSEVARAHAKEMLN